MFRYSCNFRLVNSIIYRVEVVVSIKMEGLDFLRMTRAPSCDPVPGLNPVEPLCRPAEHNYGEWSAWSECNATCGSGFTKNRTRLCSLEDSALCMGQSVQIINCVLPECMGKTRLWNSMW